MAETETFSARMKRGLSEGSNYLASLLHAMTPGGSNTNPPAPQQPAPGNKKRIPAPPELEGPISNFDGASTAYVYPSGMTAKWDGGGWVFEQDKSSVWDEQNQRWITKSQGTLPEAFR